MENVAEKFYHSLASFNDIERLIEEGENESQYLDCKSPQAPKLDRGLKQEFAEAISSFANSGGGVILWGISTTPHYHSKMDVLNGIEEIGAVKNFKKQIDLAATILVEPQLVSCQSKVILEGPSKTKGIIVTLIPPTPGDPIRSTIDREFYIRVGDKCNKMPYEILKRMFAGSSGPDLQPIFDDRLVKLQKDDSWRVPIILKNNSSAAAKDTEVSVIINNVSSCEQITGETFVDQSKINPNRKIFMANIRRPIYRGKSMIAGDLIFKMKKVKIAKRKVDLTINIFSMNMRAKTYSIIVQLAKKGLTVKETESGYLY